MIENIWISYYPLHFGSWTIDTKYYTVDVCISTASLTDDESNENVKEYIQSANCQALLFIFDLSDVSILLNVLICETPILFE